MFDFFDFSNELLCFANRSGYFTRVNRAWIKLLGLDASELIGRPYIEFVHPEDREATLAEAERLFNGNYEMLHFENRYRRRDGTYCWLAWYGRLDPLTDQVAAAARDVTSQHLQAEALQASEERLRLILESTTDAIWDADLSSGQIWWNDAYNRFFGDAPTETATSWQWWIEHIHPDDREQVVASAQAALDGDATRWTSEYRYRRADDSYVHVFDRGLIKRDAKGKAVRMLGAIQDITSRKTAEEELRTQSELIRHLFSLNERERKLVSHDIHDGLAQMVVGALMQVESARAELPEGTDSLDAAIIILRKAIAESRRLINDLRPLVIDERGISESIAHLVAEYSRVSGCEFDCSIQLEGDQFEPLFDGAIFRIVQEAIANAIKHGQATRIGIAIKHIADELHLEVSDNGCGFDTKRVSPDRFGIRGIYERAKIFGGQARIESGKGRGTTVRVHLKLPERSNAPNDASARDIPVRAEALRDTEPPVQGLAT